MQALYCVQSEAESKLIQRLFAQRARGDKTTTVYSDMAYSDSGYNDVLPDITTAVVYDNTRQDLASWVVYDFGKCECHLKCDTGDLFNLPAAVFPFQCNP